MALGFSPSIDSYKFAAGVQHPQNVSNFVDWNISNPSNLYQEMFNQQQAYNKHIEDREDSAVQRWVADVRKAGLNPWAFTGSGASTSSLTAPSRSGFDSMMSYLNFDLSKTNMQARNILGAVKIGAGLASSIINALG